MWPYIGLYVMVSFLSLQRPVMRGYLLWLIGITLIMIIGLRFEVGADWGAYLAHLLRMDSLSFFEVLRVSDFGYYLVNWVAARIGAGIWLVNLVCATIFTAGLTRFCRKLPEPFLALAVAVPYMVIVLAMGYTRQAAAFGIVLWGLVYLLEQRQLTFAVTIVIAATFHKSAVLLLPLAVLADTDRRVLTAIWVGITGVVLYALFIAEQIDHLWANYVESDYAFASEGGAIRVLMNVVPAGVLLLLRHRFGFSQAEGKLWFWMAVFSLVALPLVFQAPTAVDRVALYLMPIQLVVWSHAPGLFVSGQRPLIRIMILVAYAAVLLVWLNYATHAYTWLPYRFWPLVQVA